MSSKYPIPHPETFCKAGSVWKVVSCAGDIRPCCVFRGSFGNINDKEFDPNPLVEWEDNLRNGVKDPRCGACWHQEERGFSSHRLCWDEWGHKPNHLEILEFNLSTNCNLVCRMCNSDSSHAWIEDELFFRKYPNYSFRWHHRDDKVAAFDSDEALFRFLNTLDLTHIKKLIFKGGEPLMHRQLFLVTDYLIEKGITDLSVMFNTNGTIRNKKLKGLSPFKLVEATISIEGVGYLYQYIRGGDRYRVSDVENTVQFMEQFDNFKIISNSCISAYNIFNLAELYMWIRNNIRDQKTDFVRDHFVPLDQPKYLSIEVIPIHLREQAFRKVLTTLSNEGLSNAKIEEVFYDLLSLNKNSDMESGLLDQFIQFTKALDMRRKQSLMKAVPEYEQLDKYC